MDSNTYRDIERLINQNKKLTLSRMRKVPDRNYMIVDTLDDNFLESEVESISRELSNRFKIDRKDEDRSGNYLIIYWQD